MAFKIKIPKGLSLAISGNRRLKKALDTWLILKAIHEDGAIQIPRKGGKDIVCRNLAADHRAAFGVCYKTISTRITWLIQNGYIRDTGHGWELISWIDLGRKLNLPFCNRFYHVKPSGVKIEYILDQKTIDEKIQQCREAYRFKLKYTPGLEYEIEKIAGSANASAVYSSQFDAYYRNGCGFSENEYYVLMKILNPDFALNYRSLSRLFGYNAKGSMAYRKRKLQALGLINITPRVYEVSPDGKTTPGSRKFMMGTVKYFRPVKKLGLLLPDKIEILSHNPVIPAMEKN